LKFIRTSIDFGSRFVMVTLTAICSKGKIWSINQHFGLDKMVRRIILKWGVTGPERAIVAS
jgi:hypothetical protein